MRPSLGGLIANNPFRTEYPWNVKSSYLIVEVTMFMLWLARIVSPGSWWGAVFSYKAKHGRYYSQPHATELYLILVFVFGIFAGFTTVFGHRNTVVSSISGILIIEIVYYHFWIMIVRPRIDKNYIQYDALRTLILTFMALFNLVNFYAAIYFHYFFSEFSSDLTPWITWAYSVGEITGSGYSGIQPNGKWSLILVSGSQKLVGVFFLVIIITMSISKISRPEIGNNQEQYRSRKHRD
jgi:hypothetical protein